MYVLQGCATRNHSYSAVLYDKLNKYVQKRERKWACEEMKRETGIDGL